MRTLIAFFLSFFALGNFSQAQEKFNPKNLPTYHPKTYQKGELVEKPTKFSVPVLVTTTKDNFYLIFNSFTGLRGVVFDKNLKNITPNKKTIELNFDVNGKSAYLQALYPIKDKLYAFTTVYDKKADTKTFYCQPIDPKTLSSASSATEVAKITGVNSLREGSFQIQPSADSSRLLIYMSRPSHYKDSAIYALTVLDAEMRTLWNKTLKMPYEENFFEFQDLVVDNESNVYLLAKLYKSKFIKKEKHRGQVNYSYKILPFNSKGEQLGETDIELDEKKFVEQVSLTKSNGVLRCIGFYSNKLIEGVAGLFYLELDGQLAIKKKAYKDLSIEDIESGDGLNRNFWSETASADLLLRNYKVRFVLSKLDGSVQIVAEQHWLEYSGSSSSVAGYNSFFGNIVVINISAQGEIQWVSFIKKSEVYNGEDNSSHVSCSIGEEGSRFYFNDHAENFNPNRKHTHSPSILDKSYTTSVVLVDNNGKQTRQSISGINYEDGFILPSLSHWDGGYNMYFLRVRFFEGYYRIDKMELAD